MRSAPRPLALLAAPLLAACPSVQVAPFEDRDDLQALEETERRLWDQAREFDLALASSEALYEDVALQSYLQQVLDRLYPEFQGVLRVRILKAPVVNAFTLPSGSIYVHTGILSYFSDEAELATLLAHEGAHFTHRHALERRSQVNNALVLSTVVAVTGIPLVGDVVAISSIFGYSRSTEREADQVGFARVVRAGYDPQRAASAFRRLLVHAEAVDAEVPLFFSTHPALEERIASFEKLASGSGAGGEIGAERYRERTEAVRRYAIEADLERANAGSVLAALEEDDGRVPSYLIAFYRGEAYRQRAGEGDFERARTQFEDVLRLAPEFAPVHRSLGRLCAKLGLEDLAREHLSRYLALAPQAADRGYVESELRGMEP